MSDAVWTYHDRTSYDRYEMTGHALDWGTQPEVFKSYSDVKRLSLPEPGEFPRESISQLITQPFPPDPDREITAERLARILVLAHSLTARTRYGGAYFYFRSVASAGALYPFESYVGVTRVVGVGPGLYHHDPRDQSLALLRSGNFFTELEGAIARGDGRMPCFVLFFSSIFFRSSWKYRDRAYRYHLLDTGHLVENFMLALRAEHLNCSIHYDFDDRHVNSLLCLDAHREACLAVMPVWAGPRAAMAPAPEFLDEADPGLSEASRVSTREVDYPLIRQIHEATSSPTAIPSAAPAMAEGLGVETGPEIAVPEAKRWPESKTFAEAVHARRSMRNFVKRVLPAECLSAFLSILCAEPQSVAMQEHVAEEALQIGFLAGLVEGIGPGFYLLDRNTMQFALAQPGDRIGGMAEVCLNQGWLANCAVHFLFLCNLEVLERSWGARAYRHVMLTAGRLGQRIYLEATAMRLGCCGIGAFYDSEAALFLGLNDRTRLLYLVATGPVRKYVEA